VNGDPAPIACGVNRQKERDRVGVWGFGSVSTDVVLALVSEGLGKEIVYYSRPKGDFENRAAAWVEDLKANTARRPRLVGTNKTEDMAGLDVIFVGVGAPRRKGQTRKDLLALNTEVIAETSREIRRLYANCPPEEYPVLVYMGNPVTAMTWVGYKTTGFPREKIMGQAGNLDSRRICRAVADALELSGSDMRGIVFGDHGDSMVASPRFFSIGGIPLDVLCKTEGVEPGTIERVIDRAKKGGTHFVNETGRSASAGPARAACDMHRCIILAEPEIQPVVAIIEKEYGLVSDDDGLDTIGFGVPARIGRDGIEHIYQLPVDDIRAQLEQSASTIKEDIRLAAKILQQKYDIA